MRLFLAVNPGEKSRREILNIIDEMKAGTVRGNFTKPDNLHITLVFLGEIPPHRLEEIIGAMHQVNESPFSVRLSNVGNFSDTWWIGVEKSEPLWRLQRNLLTHCPARVQDRKAAIQAPPDYMQNARLLRRF